MADSSGPVVSRLSPQTRETMQRYQQRGLQELLRHVWKHSSFYRDYYGSHGINERDLSDISIRDLPFLSKKTLMDNFDRAVTDARLKRVELEQWIQNHRDPREAFSKDFVVLHGSGSSGELGIFVYDRASWRIADAVVAGRLPAPENYPSGKTRAAFYLASHGHFAGVSTATSMPESVYETLIVSLLEPREHAVSRLNAFQPHRLYGYSSSVSELAELAIQGALDIRPMRVFVSGDRLTDAMEETVREAWKAPIYHLYGASESKYIAVKEPAQDHLAVVEELNVVEVLDKKDRPVPPGEAGRVVLTNLYNRALPILRYELGDYVVRGPRDSESSCANISSIHGRVNDALPIVLADGSPDEIHPIVLTTFYAPGLERVQFISVRPEHVRIHYTAPRNIDPAVREEFERMLATRGATRTTFEVRRVREIPNDPQTGKLRLVKIEHDQPGPPSRPRSEQATHFRGLRVEPEEVEAIPRSRPALRGVVSEAKADYPKDQCVHQLFEEQATRTPNNVAVVFEEQVLTYDELNARANQLAHHLRALGVGPERLVAICVGRSLDMAVGILGILKAGGAWLPLDPAHPKDRQGLVFRDARAPVLLTQESLVAGLPEHGARTVLLDSDWSAISECGTSNPENVSAPADLAYVIYTSGSTGRPKGVMITHANLCHYVRAMSEPLGIAEKDIYLHTATIAFSSSTRQLMVPLTLGARVVIAATNEIRQPLELLEMVKRLMVTIVDFVPSYWRNCLNALTSLDISTRNALLENHLRLILSASEPLLPDLPRKWTFELGHGASLVNMFGQTETTGIVATYPIPPSDHLERKTVPIGGPIANTQIYLLDDQECPVPVGAAGEIYVGGPGVGRGYLNQPELTAERFVPNPFSNEVGDRLYRTGDLARCRPDGNIEFLGRIDHQVKIRGFRIEPGEIEAVLAQHPGVGENTVTAREDEPDNKRLVAYVVPRGGRAPVTGELLRNFLREKLPEYMIPSVFVMLEALPLTPSGKVDRRALTVPDQNRPELQEAFVAPRTPAEKVIAGIWAEVLGLERVGVHDNFFDLGAHSLLATLVISRVRDAFQVELSLRSLFETPTVAGLAEVIQQAKDSLAESPAPKISEVAPMKIAVVPKN